MPIFFTPRQANDVLPEVTKTMAEILRVKKTADERGDESIPKSMEELQVFMQKLADLGAELKDLEKGLVDFPAVRLGERVWLCWKIGESSVSYWHSLHEGYTGRKRIDPSDFLDDDRALEVLGDSKQARHEIQTRRQSA